MTEKRNNIRETTVINPYKPSGLSNPYQLGESTFNLRGIRNNFPFLFNFLLQIFSAHSIESDETLHSAVPHLGLYCLPMSHKQGRH